MEEREDCPDQDDGNVVENHLSNVEGPCGEMIVRMKSNRGCDVSIHVTACSV